MFDFMMICFVGSAVEDCMIGLANLTFCENIPTPTTIKYSDFKLCVFLYTLAWKKIEQTHQKCFVFFFFCLDF